MGDFLLKKKKKNVLYFRNIWIFLIEKVYNFLFNFVIYFSSLGVEIFVNVYIMGWELNWEMVSWIFMRVVWNFRGVNVIEIFVCSWVGIIFVKIRIVYLKV